MLVRVKTLTDQNFEVDAGSTISELRRAIARRVQCEDPLALKLVHKGKVLRPDGSLSESGLSDGGADTPTTLGLKPITRWDVVQPGY